MTRPHLLFDSDWYATIHPDVAASGVAPIVHYLEQGDALDYCPHPLFDPVHYGANHPELPHAGGARLIHFVESETAAAPHPLFDGAWYVARHPEVATRGVNPLLHYLTEGDAHGYWPHPLFDPEHYASQQPDLPRAGGARLLHYVETAGRCGSDPVVLFDGAGYLARNPDVEREGWNPLVHYVLVGEREGRRPHALFDVEHYRAANPDLEGLLLLAHYIHHGGAEGRSTSQLFDGCWYLRSNPEVERAGIAPLAHYVAAGDEAGCWPNPLFDPDHYGAQRSEVPARRGARLADYLELELEADRAAVDPHPLFASSWYRERYGDQLAEGQTPLDHYLHGGEAHGCWPNPLFDPAYYRRENPDLGAGIPLVAHFHEGGSGEARNPNPLFDGAWYGKRHGLKPKLDDPLAHFLRACEPTDAVDPSRDRRSGAPADVRDLDPHPLFSTTWYLEAHPEAADAWGGALGHFLHEGARSGLDPHPLFESAWYREKYGLEDDEIPIEHFLGVGAAAGFEPNRFFHTPEFLSRHAIRLAVGQTAIAAYLDGCVEKGWRPSAWFDHCVRYFRQADPALRRADVNPMAGFLSGPVAAIAHPEVEQRVHLPEVPKPDVSVIIPAYGDTLHALACVRSVASVETRHTFEVVVVDDGLSQQVRAKIDEIDHLIVVASGQQETGFVRTCNRGAQRARGRFLVFLNDDTIVTDGWLDALVETFAAHPRCGVAGSRLLHPDGRLQEAGGIVWRDGSASNYGFDQDPESLPVSFARDVDYVSGASLMIERALFEELGGFDEGYAPAFYEDTDLCFRVREAGREVIVQPASTVVHFRGASYGLDLQASGKRHQVENQRTFAERWKEALASQPEPGSDVDAAARRPLRGHMLVMDATMITPDRDSGSLRIFNLLRVMRRMGYGVTFLPGDYSSPQPYVSDLQAIGVEVACPPYVDSIDRFLERWGGRYDLCLLSRPAIGAKWLDSVRLLCPRAVVLYDTVDLHYLRRERELAVRGASAVTTEEVESELRSSRRADGVVVVSETDRELIAALDRDLDVHVLSNVHEVFGSDRSFDEREDLLFIGGFRHAPNRDAVLWFAREVLPLVRRQLPDVRFRVVGSEMPDEIHGLASESVRIEGYVADVAPLFSHCRLTVAPLRYGSGVKGKVNQSMAYGVPCVATSIAAEGMEAKAGSELLVADDTERFAAAVIELYTDREKWETLSANGLRSLERTFSLDVAERKLRDILRHYERPRESR